MSKYDLAQYLVNLHTLLQAQTASVHNASAVLSAEYDRVWAQLKETVDNEARSKQQSEGRHESGAHQQGSQPLRRG